MLRLLGSACRRLLAASFAAALAVPASAQTLELRVVGGLGGITQFVDLEAPFWSQEIGRLTDGRVSATIHSFDQSGLRGQDMLQLMRLGVVPFGTASISMSAGDEPEISAIDLPGLNPDLPTLRRNMAVYRPLLERMLQERYGIELLGVYVYPAQVLFCSRPFNGLADIRGRRIRTSSVSQSEMVEALGATPVVISFAEIVPAVRRVLVDCAITGTLSGAQIGLADATSHIHGMAISWGVSVFAANGAAWRAVPDDLRDRLREGVQTLERRIWLAAERDTQRGLDCSTGAAACGEGRRGRMTLVPASPADGAEIRRVLSESVIPRWIDRCGLDCVSGWNATLGASTGLTLSPEGRPRRVVGLAGAPAAAD